jgi:hypothetical protein
MKKTFVVFAVLFAAGPVLAEWLYNPSTRLLTEVVEEGVTPWVIQASSASSGHNIYLASNGCVKSGPSDKRRLDLDMPIRDANGMDYYIVGAGDYALSTTLVGEFVFPSNLTAVPTYFFRNCTSMTNCIFRSNLETIGDNAFRNLQMANGHYASWQV